MPSFDCNNQDSRAVNGVELGREFITEICVFFSRFWPSRFAQMRPSHVRVCSVNCSYKLGRQLQSICLQRFIWFFLRFYWFPTPILPLAGSNLWLEIIISPHEKALQVASITFDPCNKRKTNPVAKIIITTPPILPARIPILISLRILSLKMKSKHRYVAISNS